MRRVAPFSIASALLCDLRASLQTRCAKRDPYPSRNRSTTSVTLSLLLISAPDKI